MNDKNRGLYHKFNIARTDGSSGPGGKHEHCEYFVLDLAHDKHAMAAISAYADSCEKEFPALAADLRRKLKHTIWCKGLDTPELCDCGALQHPAAPPADEPHSKSQAKRLALMRGESPRLAADERAAFEEAYRNRGSTRIVATFKFDRHPSGDYKDTAVAFAWWGWQARAETWRNYWSAGYERGYYDGVTGAKSVLARAEQPAGEPEMCPNCLTPWKCNGPHEPAGGAGAPSPAADKRGLSHVGDGVDD